MTRFALALAVLCLSACSDGPTTPSSQPSQSPPPQQSSLVVVSQPGDPFGLGRTYRFTPDIATFTHDVDQSNRGAIVINVASNDRQSYWTVRMGPPAGQQLGVGTYERAEWFTALAGSNPRFSLSGDGRACAGLEARFVIHELTYNGTIRISALEDVPVIKRLHVSFEARCTTTSAPGLSGELALIAP